MRLITQAIANPGKQRKNMPGEPASITLASGGGDETPRDGASEGGQAPSYAASGIASAFAARTRSAIALMPSTVNRLVQYADSSW